MKGIWLENKQIKLKTELPIPQPPLGESLVRVIRAGICNTDLELLQGYYPYTGILGHEFVGIVEQGADNLIGKRVVGEINAVCGQCRFCRQGNPTHCEQRTVLGIVNRNGAFAEYLSLPVANLHPLPDNISTDAATFTEPLAAALEIQEQIAIALEDRVLVVGDGKLGQLVAQTLALTGCELLVIGRHRQKLEKLESQGIKVGFADLVRGCPPNRIRGLVRPVRGCPPNRIRGLVRPVKSKSFDIAVECTGNPDGFNLALQGLRPRGTLVLKSTYAGKLTLDASSLVVDEITVIGSRCGPLTKAIELLDRGQIDVTSLIETTYPLEEGLAAFDHAQQRGALKVLLQMD